MNRQKKIYSLWRANKIMKRSPNYKKKSKRRSTQEVLRKIMIIVSI